MNSPISLRLDQENLYERGTGLYLTIRDLQSDYSTHLPYKGPCYQSGCPNSACVNSQHVEGHTDDRAQHIYNYTHTHTHSGATPLVNINKTYFHFCNIDLQEY